MKTCPTCKAIYPAEFSVCPKDAAKLRETTELVAGSIIRGKYKIIEKLGEGGMGVVYKAWHLHFEELCALKVVSAHLAAEPGFLQRFRTEAQSMRRLSHPHAVRVNDFDETEDGRPFMAMEFVEGHSLADLLDRGAMDPARGVRIVAQVCEALGAAHQLGIIHRDIKPANILVAAVPDGSEHAKVGDFGVAKVTEHGRSLQASLTGTGFVVGTPDYMSPEQAQGLRGDQLDGRSDLYSLGVVLYEVLTGRRPFTGDTPIMILMAHINAQPPDPRAIHAGLPEPLARIVLRALEKKPEQRFASAAEMRQSLAEVQQLLGTSLKSTVQWVGRRSTPDAATLHAAPRTPADTPTDRVLTPLPAPPRTAPARQEPEIVYEEIEEPAQRPKWLYALAATTVIVVFLAVGNVIRVRFFTEPESRAQDASSVTVPLSPNSAAPAPDKSTGSNPAPAKRATEPETRGSAPVNTLASAATSPAQASPPQQTQEPVAPSPAQAEPSPTQPPKREVAVAASEVPAAPAATVPESPRVVADRQRASDLQTNFEAGRTAMDQASGLRSRIARAPAAERAALEQQLAQLEQTAIAKLQAAERAVPAPNPSRPMVLGNLAQSYESAGRYGEAAAAFREASQLKPDDSAYLIGLGTSLAKAGRFNEGEAVCRRAEPMGANVAGTCWRNVGIVHFNAMHPADAIEPLRRATSLQPDEPTGWFLLGVASLSQTQFNRSATRVLPVLPREAEASLQRYLQLSPAGGFASPVRAVLNELQAIRGGIATRYDAPAPPSLLRAREPRARAPGDVAIPRGIAQPAPKYPALAKLARVQGTVQLEAVIAKDGSILSLEAKSGNPLLYTAALDAVRQWRYQPTLQRGAPAEVVTFIDVNFRMN